MVKPVGITAITTAFGVVTIKPSTKRRYVFLYGRKANKKMEKAASAMAEHYWILGKTLTKI